MKKLIFLCAALFLFQLNLTAQSSFELDPSQSMLMTGKGPGQDGAINPYYGQDSFAIVENTGTSEFSVRIQQSAKVIEIIPIASKEVKKVKLLKNYQLYIDSNSEENIMLQLDFEPIDD